MPKKVPPKNIEPFLVDVKKPGFNYGHLHTAKLNLAHIPQKPKRSKRRKRIFLSLTTFVLVFFVFSVGLIIYNVGATKSSLIASSKNIVSNFSNSISALRNFKPSEAVSPLRQNNEELSSLNDFFKQNQFQTLLNILGRFVPTLKSAGSLLGQASQLNSDFLNLSSNLADLQVNGLKYFENDGQTLIQRLAAVHDLTSNILNEVESVRNAAVNLKDVSSFFGGLDNAFGQDYLKYRSDLYTWNKFLGSALNLLNSQNEKHILLLFQNPAELRPGGGFDGSYADLTVRNGQMRGMDVRDIYDPDGQLDLKVVPPQPLQGLTHDWGARDANWFFDFPTSAKTVLNFLEQSKMYSEKNITFEGVIALNINVLQSVLALTGPINLPDYKITIDQDNFLNEIQREVEAGQDRQKIGYPKHILQVLTPIILGKLNNLSENEVAQFAASLKDHLTNKDIMFYARDPDLANLISAADVDGAVYDLPNTFWGNYLAVVNANVAGGKSDVFMNQNINAQVNIDTDGSIFTDLTVTRIHTGNTQKDPWWRATNQDFFQVYVNPGAALFSLKGNDARPLPKGSDYGNYSVNPDLAAIENTLSTISNYNAWTMSAFGKEVFAGWLYTPAGQTKTLDIRYQTPAPSQLEIRDGTSYQFIFDRQSGTSNENLKVSVSAPLGFIWNESQSPVFDYSNANPAGRVILNLTLKKTSL